MGVRWNQFFPLTSILLLGVLDLWGEWNNSGVYKALFHGFPRTPPFLFIKDTIWIKIKQTIQKQWNEFDKKELQTKIIIASLI
jgi:hypothetical protein